MPPMNLLIKPASSLCNMRCQYCFYADVSQHRMNPSYGVMAEDTLDALVRKAFACADGVCGFAFQGGEPTLAGLDFFRTFAAMQDRYNTRGLQVRNAIQTNGLAIDDDWAAYLAERHFLVGLSLDGTAAIHNELRPDAQGKGTYARVNHAAALLRRHGCEYNILCVVTRPVARHAASVYSALRQHRYLQFIPCIDGFEGGATPLSLTPELLGQFLKTTFDLYYHDYMHGQYVSVRTFDNYVHMLTGKPPENCAMNGTCTCNLVIEGDGGAYPCDFYVLDRWKLGNVREDDLQAMMASPLVEAFVDMSRAADPGCAACRWAALCRGGCRRDRELPDGQGIGPNRFCEAYQSFFAYAYDRLAEMAQREMRRR